MFQWDDQSNVKKIQGLSRKVTFCFKVKKVVSFEEKSKHLVRPTGTQNL
jgi:hypothetical protein